jgi:hypothetical protein
MTTVDTAKLAETSKLITAAASELICESAKLQAETAKLAREARWYPAIVSVAFIAAVVAVAKLFIS